MSVIRILYFCKLFVYFIFVCVGGTFYFGGIVLCSRWVAARALLAINVT